MLFLNVLVYLPFYNEWTKGEDSVLLEFLQIIAIVGFITVFFIAMVIVTFIISCILILFDSEFRKEVRKEISELFWDTVYYCRETIVCQLNRL